MPAGSAHLVQHVSSERAELEQPEQTSTRNAGLAIEEAPAVAPRDDDVGCHRDEQNQDERRKQRDERRCDDQIEDSLRDGASMSSASGVYSLLEGVTGRRCAPGSVLPPTPRTNRTPPGKRRPSRRRTSARRCRPRPAPCPRARPRRRGMKTSSGQDQSRVGSLPLGGLVRGSCIVSRTALPFGPRPTSSESVIWRASHKPQPPFPFVGGM